MEEAENHVTPNLKNQLLMYPQVSCLILLIVALTSETSPAKSLAAIVRFSNALIHTENGPFLALHLFILPWKHFRGAAITDYASI